MKGIQEFNLNVIVYGQRIRREKKLEELLLIRNDIRASIKHLKEIGLIKRRCSTWMIADEK